MSRFERSIPADYFDTMYAGDPDPWRFAASPYEQEKYAATLGSLPEQRYQNALEVGCSIGVLTRQLASRCGSLLALDVAQAALDQARRRCLDLDHVRFALSRIPDDWPDDTFDLIVLSEVIYYLDRGDVARLAACVKRSIKPATDIVLVHWLGETHYPLSGDEAAELFTAESAGFAAIQTRIRTEQYRLDVLRSASDRGHGAR